LSIENVVGLILAGVLSTFLIAALLYAERL
jgi:hypothetical protein